jgi:hypothetical protein
MTFQLYKSPSLADFMFVCHKLRPDEREQMEAFTGQPYNPDALASAKFASAGPRWVLCAGETPLCIAGFDMIRPGVWQDWMLSTPEAWADGAWRETTRATRKVMDAMIGSEAHRLQCVSLASRTEAHRWYKVLKLKFEGKLEGYGANGEDALMFARVRS